MKPYYDHSGIIIYHADCREVMPTLASVDLVVVDPPYVGMVGGYSYPDSGGVAKKDTDSMSLGDPWSATFEWAPMATELCSLGAMVFTTYHALPETALAFASLRRAALITWHKRNAPTQGANVPRFTEEYVWCLAKKPGLKWDALKSTMIDIPKLATGCMASAERIVDDHKRALHPTQKPLAVMHRLLVVGGASLCDPFMGTGTTLLAAKQRGMRAIGIEIEERYCEMAAKRMEQEMLPLGEPEKKTSAEQISLIPTGTRA